MIFVYHRNGFLTQCRLVSNETARAPEKACSLGDEDLFEEFLAVTRRLYGQTHESITKGSWRAHCQLQLMLKDTRSPILCEAAAFIALPFPLRADSRKKIEEEVDRNRPTQVRM